MVFNDPFFIGSSPWYLIVVPNIRYENIYDLPDGTRAYLLRIAREIDSIT